MSTAGYLIDEAHHPHPDLHAVIRIGVYPRKDTLVKGHHVKNMDFGECCTVTVRYKVPEHVPFELIPDLILNFGISQGPRVLWDLFVQQDPEEARAILTGFNDNPGINVRSIEGYVHGDGTPYDTTPLQKDRVDRVLGESRDLNAVVKFTFHAPLGHGGGDDQTVPVSISIPDWVNIEKVMAWVHHFAQPFVLAKEQHPGLEQKVGTEFPTRDMGELVGYVHSDGSPYDITPLQRDRVSRAMGEAEVAPQLWLDASVVLELNVNTKFPYEEVHIHVPWPFGYREFRQLQTLNDFIVAVGLMADERIDEDPVVGLVYQSAITAFYDKKPVGTMLRLVSFAVKEVAIVDAEGKSANLQPQAKSYIDALLKEDEPEDVLLALLKVNVSARHILDDDPDAESAFELAVDVTHGEFDKVRDLQWWNSEGDDRIWDALQRDFPKEARALEKRASDEMAEIVFDVHDVRFVDYFHNPVDTSTPEFQRKRVSQNIGEEELPHPGLHARVQASARRPFLYVQQ